MMIIVYDPEVQTKYKTTDFLIPVTCLIASIAINIFFVTLVVLIYLYENDTWCTYTRKEQIKNYAQVPGIHFYT